MEERTSQVLQPSEPVRIDPEGGEPSLHASKRTAALPGHLVGLPEPNWAMWRWSCVRGAGFPITQLLQFATPPCIMAIDAFLSHEALTKPLQQKLQQEISQLASGLPAKLRRQLRKAKKQIL